MLQRNFSKALNVIFILLLFTHMKMKKMLVGAFLEMFAIAGVAVNFASAQDSNFNTNWWWWMDDNTARYNPKVAGSTEHQGDALIVTIRTAINWVLGMLSLVALVLCLYAGFLMMTSSGDENKYKKGVGIMKWAAIGLAIIALSWLIVSLIFWVINGSIGGAVDSSEVSPS